jgi:hypothetical protein
LPVRRQYGYSREKERYEMEMKSEVRWELDYLKAVDVVRNLVFIPNVAGDSKREPFSHQHITYSKWECRG